MKKARIVETTYPDGTRDYTIQQKHFLFRCWWVSASCNYPEGALDTFNTLEKAKENLWFFDGSKPVSKVVYP